MFVKSTDNFAHKMFESYKNFNSAFKAFLKYFLLYNNQLLILYFFSALNIFYRFDCIKETRIQFKGQAMLIALSQTSICSMQITL